MTNKERCVTLASVLELKFDVFQRGSSYFACAGTSRSSANSEDAACEDLAEILRLDVREALRECSPDLLAARLERRSASHAFRDAAIRLEKLRKELARVEKEHERYGMLSIATSLAYDTVCSRVGHEHRALIDALNATELP